MDSLKATSPPPRGNNRKPKGPGAVSWLLQQGLFFRAWVLLLVQQHLYRAHHAHHARANHATGYRLYPMCDGATKGPMRLRLKDLSRAGRSPSARMARCETSWIDTTSRRVWNGWRRRLGRARSSAMARRRMRSLRSIGRMESRLSQSSITP